MQFITRAYNQISLGNLGTIQKKSTEVKLEKEYEYYTKVPSQLQIFNPRVIDFSKIDNEYTLELEYYAYNNLSHYMTNVDLDLELWNNVAKFLYNSLVEFEKVKYVHFSVNDVQSYKHSMYIKKTENEYYNLKNNFEYFSELSKYDHLLINGIEYKNFEVIWSQIQKYIDQNIVNEKECMSFIHGDFCFSNILCGVNDNKQVTLKYIDPRGTFGIDGCHGDKYYDLAKLKHSVDGAYEYIIYDLFQLNTKSNQINFSFKNDNSKKVLELFNQQIFHNFDQNKIDLLQGLIYIGMCARHYDSLDRQKIMYSTGIRLLNSFLWNNK